MDKVEKMMRQLSQAYNDPEMDKRPDLKEVIFRAAQELEKDGTADLVASKLCKEIPVDYLINKKDFPEAMFKLYYQLKGKETKYDGIAMASIFSSVWF